MKSEKNRRKSIMAILFAVVMIASVLVVMSLTIFISGAFADNSSSPNKVPDDYISPSDTVSHDGIITSNNSKLVESQASPTPQAPDLKSPPCGTTTDNPMITFGWYNVKDAQKYLLQVDNNSDFRSPEIETYTDESQFTPRIPLSDNTYYWRVKVIDRTNNEGDWSLVWNITIYTTGVLTKAQQDLGIQPVVQHKDTRMLCLGGCPLLGAHAWNVNHVTRGCPHCDQYCVRASISMVNSYYGGSLSQDRISYYIFEERPGVGDGLPENDLGHGRGTSHSEARTGLSWALNNAAITQQMGKPTFEEIKEWIDASRPIFAIIPVSGGELHAVVIDGYHEDLFGLIDWLHVVDPWTGIESSFWYATYSFERVYIPESGAGARSDEASLSQDSDGDGVVNFDEINRFLTDPNKVDSDGDGVPDKAEIRCYTFLSDDSFDSGDTRKPDPDGDGLRAERDTDSDNGGVHDGCEDLNKNGVVDSGETDPLNKDDDQRGLDLIFTIDTTGSMWDDIANVKASATEIVNAIDASIPNYRIAVVDYRDFPEDPYGGPGDYPFHDQLAFSTDKPTIVAGIQGLTLGDGADWRESVYSALMHSIDATSLGGWRGDDYAMKAIILMGDAPPHDPEPFTGYTLSSVITAAELADPVICYPIQIGGEVETFEEIASGTGGEDFTAEDADDVVDAILEAIETIATKPVADPNGPYTGTEGVPITFDGSGSYDPDGTIVSYDWDFDDGGTGTGENPTHTYAGAEIYTVTLTVTDNDALTDTKTTTATIVPCPCKYAVYQAKVSDPEGILNPIRELRDGYLKEEYVDRYYDYSTELTMVMTKDPALAYEAARLLVKYLPMIQQQVTGTGKVKLITGRDVEEVVSFTDGLKRSVLKNRGEIGATRSQETIKFMDEFKEQVEASEGKTFSEALQSSIYCESEPMPDLVITNIRLDGNKVKYTIKNQGEAATGGLFVNTLLVDGVPVSEDLINRLIQPGQSLEKTFILSRPLKISPNTTIVVCADYENKVPESDEENNCLVLE